MNGFTKEEKFLNSLSADSFLRFWSWPNLFRDQGNKSGEKRDFHNIGDGKEICDLTIIFGNDVLLFSDKRIEYNKTKETNIAWSRWARRAIGDSVKQIKGARRWLTNYPERVFLDSKCMQMFPIDIPPKDKINFHNIVVCHGIEDILLSFNNEASFIFDNSIKDNSHWDKDNCQLFRIGQIFEEDFVHVFNESTIMKEFDQKTLYSTLSWFLRNLIQQKTLYSTFSKENYY